ncbi:MAG: acyl--CoA ligase [Rhodospirillales bacterium]|nr:acyl--CoA ligase [Rhodospirillales bacterium]
MLVAQIRWSKEIATEVVKGVPYRMYAERPRRVEDLLTYTQRWSARPHIIQDDRVFTFDELGASVAAKAAALQDHGARHGARVLMLGRNGIEWVVNFWACLAAGAVPVLANTWWSATEVATALRAMDPALVLADAHATPKLPHGTRCADWTVSVPSEIGVVAPSPCGEEEETCLVIFTSGTSSDPKAVILSHRAIIARLQMTLHVTRKMPHQIDEAVHDVTLLTGPLFHVGTMQALLRAMVVGDTLVLSSGRFDPGEVLHLIERHKVNRWNAVPTMVSRVLDHPDLPHRDLGSLKSISIGGAPVHAELIQRIRIGLPGVNPRIPTGYGLTENGGQATAAAGTEDIKLLGSSGRPLPCVELGFLDHPGLPDAEILLRSPTQMSGYCGLDETPIDSEGWLHTGDLGRVDESGNLWITGRCKDMIIRGGENIAPVAVERALETIPGVSEAVVFGVPHADLGEEVMAVVVIEDDLTIPQVIAQLRGKVASFAVPTRWRLQRENLPTNHTGKVDKPTISARARAELALGDAARAT